MATSAAPQIHHEENDCTISTFENSIIWCFRGEATLARIRHAQPLHRQLVRRYPQGFAVCTIIGDGVPLSMPSDARELSAAITKEFQRNYCALCEIVVGTGFRASVVRSITGSFRLLARATCPSKVFAESGPCATWLAPLMGKATGTEVEVAALGAAMQRVLRGPG